MNRHDCMLCGAPRPVGHLRVIGKRLGINVGIGRVCSGHTLKELVLDPKGQFEITVKLVPEAER